MTTNFATALAHGRAIKFTPLQITHKVSLVPPVDLTASEIELERVRIIRVNLEIQLHEMRLEARTIAERECIEPKLSIGTIMMAVAKFYGFRRDEVWSRRRTVCLIRPRQIAMYLAKELTVKSLPEIARRMGNYDHTTILYAVKKIGNLLNTDAGLYEEVEYLRYLLTSPQYDPNQLALPLSRAAE